MKRRSKSVNRDEPEDLLRLRGAIDAIDQGFQIVGFDWRYQYMNAAAARHGRRSREELLGRTMMECYPGIEQTEMFRALERCMTSRHSAVIENEFTYPDGTRAWFELRIEPAPEGIAVLSLDITLRKRAEQHFQSVVEASPNGLIMVDRAGRIAMVNREAERLFGYSCDELLGESIEQLVPERAREPHAALRGAHDGRTVHRPLGAGRELSGRRKDGTEIPVEIGLSPVETAGGTFVLASVVDIAARHAMETALRQSEERYRLLFQANPHASWVLDTETLRFVAVNDAAIQLYGFSREEFLAMTARDIRPPEDVAAFVESMREQRQSARLTKGWRHRRKDGSLIDVEVSAQPLEFEGRAAMLVLVTDVTERNQLEAQYRQAQKMEAVGRLAGGVAHDFNNLLTVITSYSELLLEDCGETDPRRPELLEIRRAAGMAATLTRQLLAFSRQQVLEPRVLDLNDVVTGAEKMLTRLIGEDIRLVTTLAPAAGAVRADAGQIEQVIMNLAVNARDAMPDGGALTLETANVEFTGEYVEGHFPAQRGRYVMLAVTDTGAGMSAETQARIFEPFFTTKEAGKGTGLGLATVYGIVKQSGGFIWVYSEPGAGTTFKIYLPRVDEAAVPERRGQPADALGGSETILLVEDSDPLRDIASRVLERRGYTLLEASDGETALAIAAQHSGKIDLLLTDVVMPEMNGRQLAERLTALRPALKVLYMSGYAGDAVTRRGVIERGMAYLQKPFTPDALARKVREVLNR